ncbi:hypothetical protein [Streptomyces sp. NPDC059639]|uniref:hypothetical protein n=1 Tax=Streptomyces sp. NPDC059639 TaxID=3346891 RepID=UPI0036C380FF
MRRRRLLLVLSVMLAVGSTGCATVDGRVPEVRSPAVHRQLVPDGSGEPMPTVVTTAPAPVQPAAREALVNTTPKKPKKPRAAKKRHAAPPQTTPHRPRRSAGQVHRPAPVVQTPAQRRAAVRPAAPHRRAPVHRHRTITPQPKATYADLGVVCGWSKQAGVDPALTAACRRTAR